MSMTPKAIEDLLDELEASRAARKRAWACDIAGRPFIIQRSLPFPRNRARKFEFKGGLKGNTPDKDVAERNNSEQQSLIYALT